MTNLLRTERMADVSWGRLVDYCEWVCISQGGWLVVFYGINMLFEWGLTPSAENAL